MEVNIFLTTYLLLIKLLLEIKRRLSWLLLLIHLWLELILLGRRLKVLLVLHIIAIAILRNSIQPFGWIAGRFDGFSLRFFLSTFFGCCQIFEIKIKFFGGFFLPCVIINNIFIYRTRAIITRGLYLFYPIFHCGLYLRAVCTAERLVFTWIFFHLKLP